MDTSGLLRAVFFPKELTRLGRTIVEMAQEYQAGLVVPTIVLVEMEHEIRRRKEVRQTFDELLAAIMEAEYIRIEPLGTEQVRLQPELLLLLETHDRIIVAHALTNDAPLITKDHLVRESGLVECIR